MRLTLRTLLAYLDDRLPPANAKEIGQKIANSPFATELVDRIRDVKRRRRLASPDQQVSVNPNLIAEYLDDQLSPELVSRVETQILSSDALLAEVAASHEILGLLRDPVTVEPRLRDRLHALDPTGTTDVVRALAAESSSAASAATKVPEWKPLASRVAGSGRFPVVIAVVLGVVWIGLIATDNDLFGPTPEGGVVQAPPANAAEPEPVPAENAIVAAAADQPNADKAAGLPEASPVAANDADAGDKKAASNDQEAQPANEPASVAEPAVAAAAPGTAAPAAAQPLMTDSAKPDASGSKPPAGEPVVPPVAPQQVAEEPAVFLLQAENSALFVLEETLRTWRTLAQIPGGDAVSMAPNRVSIAPILAGQWFAVPQGFQTILQTDSKGWMVTVPGPAVLRLRTGGSGGIDLYSGRFWLTVNPTHVWKDAEPPEFELGTGKAVSLIAMKSVETEMAFEANAAADESPLPENADVAGVAVESDKTAHVPVLVMDSDLKVSGLTLKGAVEIRMPDSEESATVAANERISWTVLSREKLSSLVVEQGVSALVSGKWLLTRNESEIPEAIAIRNRVLAALAVPDEPGAAVLPLVKDRNPQVGEAAVQVLAVIRDIDRMLTVLYEPADELIHRAAIDGLSAIAGTSPSGHRAVETALETRLPMSEVEPTLHLISGLTSAQAADPAVAQDLMAMLSSDRPTNRTLAIYRMEQITNDRMGYHPDSEASRRREAIRRWQRYLDKNDGRLLPR